MGVMKYL